MIAANARGHLNASDWDVAGSVGPVESLYTGRDVDQALSGHLGVSSLSIRGRVRDPLTLGGPNVAREAVTRGSQVFALCLCISVFDTFQEVPAAFETNRPSVPGLRRGGSVRFGLRGHLHRETLRTTVGVGSGRRPSKRGGRDE